MRESRFQQELREDLEQLLPGCMIFKLDPNLYGQGIPDLLVLYKNFWIALECKAHSKAPTQPNQNWYIDTMNEMSYAAFIYPENREEILDEIRSTFRTRRSARLSQR